jgi:GAF domain-containing protein
LNFSSSPPFFYASDEMNPPEVVSPASPPAFGAVSAYASFSTAAKNILQEKDLTRVLRVICEEACRILGADRSMVLRIKMDGSYQRDVFYAYNFPQDYLNFLESSRHKPILPEVHQERRLAVYSNFGAKSEKFLPEETRNLGIRTLCGIPLVVEGEILAVLNIYHPDDREYGPEERQLAEAFGDLASIAIENSRLLAETEGRAARLEIVDRIARIVGSTLEPGKIFESIAEEVCRAVPCDRFVIADFDWEAGRFQFYLEKSSGPMGPPLESDIEAGLMSRQLYQTKKPLNVPDLLESIWADSRHAREGYRSVLMIPVIQEDRCIAHLRLASKEPGKFTDADEELLVSVSGHLGPAIRNADLFRTAQERSERLEIVGEIARAVGSELEPADLFKTIVREIRRVVPCERCVIETLKEGVRHSWHIESDIEVEPLAGGASDSDGELGGVVYEEKRPVNIPDIREHTSPRAVSLPMRESEAFWLCRLSRMKSVSPTSPWPARRRRGFPPSMRNF